MTDTSYVANIKIEKVKRTDSTVIRGNQAEPKREVVETLNLTIKAPSIVKLQEKVAAHVSLLDEDDL